MKVYPISTLRRAFLSNKEEFASEDDIAEFRKYFSGIEELVKIYPNSMNVFAFKNTLAFDKATAEALHKFAEERFKVPSTGLRHREITDEVPEIVIDSLQQVAQLKMLQNESVTLYKSKAKQDAANSVVMQKQQRLESLKDELVAGTKLVCLDIEVFEYNHDKILEIGYSILNTKKSSVIRSRQFVVEENLSYRNKRFVPDHKFDFNFGDPVVAPEWIIIRKLKEELKDADYIVGHSISDDIKFLKEHIEIKTDTLDTQNYSGFLEPGAHQMKLSKMLDHLDIPYSYLHNAGNDCRYTLDALIALCHKFNKEPMTI